MFWKKVFLKKTSAQMFSCEFCEVFKNPAFFLVKLTLLNVRGMSNDFVTDYVLAWRFWASKNLSLKINESYNGFLLWKENMLCIQFGLLFLHAILNKYKKVSRVFFIEYTIKVARKMSSTDHTVYYTSCCLTKQIAVWKCTTLFAQKDELNSYGKFFCK